MVWLSFLLFYHLIQVVVDVTAITMRVVCQDFFTTRIVDVVLTNLLLHFKTTLLAGPLGKSLENPLTYDLRRNSIGFSLRQRARNPIQWREICARKTVQ